jgi:ribosomal-protein-serine acetyltransferase
MGAVSAPATQQLVVRRWEPGDVPALHEAVLDSIEHLRPWMPWIAKEPLGLEERRQLVAGWIASWEAGDRVCGLFVGDRVVGCAGLHDRIGPTGREIGYWVRAGETGRGYATIAARTLTDMAFAMPGITRVEIQHDVANVASGRVPAKLGFTPVREVPHAPEAPGETGLRRVWRVERDRWRARRAELG